MNDINHTKITTLNFRYLAYIRDPDRNQWLIEWDKMLKGRYSSYRIQRLLEGTVPTDEELNLFASVCGESAEAIRSTRLFNKNDDLICQNLLFLKSLIPPNEGKIAAIHTGVSYDQLIRWGKRVRKPHPKHLEKLLDYLYIDPLVDLYEQPLFLSLTSPQSKNKIWLRDQIERMSIKDIDAALPAFKRIIQKSEFTEPS